MPILGDEDKVYDWSAYEYRYEITGLKVQDVVNNDGDTLSDSVCVIKFIKVGVKDGLTGSYSGSIPVSAENVPASDFVAFSDLTQETVSEWLDKVIPERAMIEINLTIENSIKQQTVKDVSLPWQNAAPVMEQTNEV